MHSERQKEIILFLEENGFIEGEDYFFHKEIANKIIVMVGNFVTHNNQVALRIFYSDRFPRMSDTVFFFVFDKKLIFDISEFSEDIVNKAGFDLVSYTAHYRDRVFEYFSSGENRIKYVDNKLSFV